MLTAPWPSSSTASMIRLLPREKPTPLLVPVVMEVTKEEPRLEVGEPREVREAELEAGGDLRAPPPLPEAPTLPPLEVTLEVTLLAILASAQLTLGTAPRLAAPSADTAAGGATPGTSTCPMLTRSRPRSTVTTRTNTRRSRECENWLTVDIKCWRMNPDLILLTYCINYFLSTRS